MMTYFLTSFLESQKYKLTGHRLNRPTDEDIEAIIALDEAKLKRKGVKRFRYMIESKDAEYGTVPNIQYETQQMTEKKLKNFIREMTGKEPVLIVLTPYRDLAKGVKDN